MLCYVFIHQELESTDAAPEVLHPRPTQLPARWTASVVFFFFSRIRVDTAQFAPMRIDLRRTGLIWP